MQACSDRLLLEPRQARRRVTFGEDETRWFHHGDHVHGGALYQKRVYEDVDKPTWDKLISKRSRRMEREGSRTEQTVVRALIAELLQRLEAQEAAEKGLPPPPTPLPTRRRRHRRRR